MKRIRAGSPVDLTPSDWRGRALPEADTIRGAPRLLSVEESGAAEEALSGKYGFQYRVFDFVESRVPRNPPQRIYLEPGPL